MSEYVENDFVESDYIEGDESSDINSSVTECDLSEVLSVLNTLTLKVDDLNTSNSQLKISINNLVLENANLKFTVSALVSISEANTNTLNIFAGEGIEDLKSSVSTSVLDGLSNALPTEDDESLLIYPIGSKVITPAWEDYCEVTESKFVPTSEYEYTVVYTVKNTDDNGVTRFGNFYAKDVYPFDVDKWVSKTSYDALLAEYNSLIGS